MSESSSYRPTLPTQTQVSAGGVAFRRRDSQIDVALILVGAQKRWQLPKGLLDEGESPEETALREVREEAGIETELLAPHRRD
jgi:8-oxo-dGTP pyrophosphatase MutT (NUDIX family)